MEYLKVVGKNVYFYNIKGGMNFKLNFRRENSHATKQFCVAMKQPVGVCYT